MMIGAIYRGYIYIYVDNIMKSEKLIGRNKNCRLLFKLGVIYTNLYTTQLIIPVRIGSSKCHAAKHREPLPAKVHRSALKIVSYYFFSRMLIRLKQPLVQHQWPPHCRLQPMHLSEHIPCYLSQNPAYDVAFLNNLGAILVPVNDKMECC